MTGYYFMAGPDRFCFGVQERKVAGHSRGVSDLKLTSCLLTFSKHQEISLKFEAWFVMHPLTSAGAKIVS